MIKTLIKVFAKDQQSIKYIKASKTKKIIQNLLIILLIAAAFWAMLTPLLVNADEIKKVVSLDLGSITLLIGAYLTFMLAIISSVGFIFSSCYLDKNLENYVVMPLKTRDFTIAKLINVYKNVMTLVLLIYVPLFILYFYFGEISFIALLITVFYIITMPIITVYVVALLIGILMFFVNKVKNKKLAKNILYFGSMIVFMGLYLGVVMKFSMSGSADVSELIAMATGIVDKIKVILFYPTWYSSAFNNFEYINILYMIIGLLVCIPIQLFFERVYFKGSIGFNQDGGSKSKRRKDKVDKIANYSETRWFFYREYREITKSMTYFMNSIFGNILIVVIYLGMMGYSYFFGGLNKDSEFLDLISSNVNAPMIILITLALGTFFTIFNNGAASVFSRDAKALDFIDTLPIDRAKAFFGKVLFHGIVEFLTIFIFMVIPMIVLKIPVQYILLSVVVMIIVMLATIFIPITIDLNFPTLDWESETVVVKRAKSIWITMITHFLLNAVVIGGAAALLIYAKIDYKVLAYIGLGFYICMFIVMNFIYRKSVVKAFKIARQ